MSGVQEGTELQRRAQVREAAQQDLDKFYKERQAQIQQRQQERAQTDSTENESASPSNIWESIASLASLHSHADHCPSREDTDRMYHVLSALARPDGPAPAMPFSQGQSHMAQFSFPTRSTFPAMEVEREEVNPPSSPTPPPPRASSPEKKRTPSPSSSPKPVTPSPTSPPTAPVEKQQEENQSPPSPTEETPSPPPPAEETSEGNEEEVTEEDFFSDAQETKSSSEDLFADFGGSSATSDGFQDFENATAFDFPEPSSPTSAFDFPSPQESTFDPFASNTGSGESMDFFPSSTSEMSFEAAFDSPASGEETGGFSYGGSAQSDSDEEDSYGYGSSSRGYYDDSDDDDGEATYGGSWRDTEENDDPVASLEEQWTTASDEEASQFILKCIERHADEVLFQIRQSTSMQDRLRSLLPHARAPGTGHSALHVAVLSRAEEWFDMALTCGCPESTDVDHNTPLHLAAALGQATLVESLLHHGYDVQACNINQRTPLHLALVHGHTECATLLIAEGRDLTQADKEGMTPLHLACLRSSEPLVTSLLKKEKSVVHQKDHQGRTPLHAAAHSLNADLCISLVKAGADVHARDDQQRTALHWCLLQPDRTSGVSEVAVLDCVQSLLAPPLRMSLEARDQQERHSLHYAAYYGFAQSVNYLMGECGVSVNVLDINQQSPLFAVVASLADDLNTEALVDTLLGAGADSFQQASNGQCAIHVAIARNKYNTANTLYQHMTDGDMDRCDQLLDAMGQTLLHCCAQSSMEALGLDLLSAQPDLFDKRTTKKQNLLHALGRGGSLELVETLRHLMPAPALYELVCEADERGRTPLHMAAASDSLDIVQEFVALIQSQQGSPCAMIRQRDQHGLTMVHYAALRGSFFVLEYVLTTYPKLASLRTKRGQSLLHTAAAGAGDCRCIQLLLDGQVDVNGKDSSGRTPIFYTLRDTPHHARVDALKLLLASSADVNVSTHKQLSFVSAVQQTPDAATIQEILTPCS